MIEAIVENGYRMDAINLETWAKHYICPSMNNRATVISSDDNGMVVIKFNHNLYLVQSIDLEYPEKGE